ncbi:MAG: ABC transporter permease [Thiotrichales bacterium]
MKFSHIRAVFLSRTREFYRDKASLMWNLAMPVLIVFAFATIFSGNQADVFKIGIVDPAPADSVKPALLDFAYVTRVIVSDLDAGITKVERQQLDLLLAPDRDGARYWVNDESARGYLAERLLLGGAAAASEQYVRQTVSGRALRYVDWVVPGVLAMNMMFSALWGVGYVIVRYRKNGVLRRFSATPLTATEFLFAQVLSRMAVITVVSILVYVGSDLALDFTMRGSHLVLGLVFLAGAFSLVCVGLLISARTRSEELADGLLNLLSWPMMLLSGMWFSLEGSPAFVQQVAQLLPLTHLIAAARAVMIDGAGLTQVWGEIAILVAVALAALLVAARLFKWQ